MKLFLLFFIFFLTLSSFIAGWILRGNYERGAFYGLPQKKGEVAFEEDIPATTQDRLQQISEQAIGLSDKDSQNLSVSPQEEGLERESSLSEDSLSKKESSLETESIDSTEPDPSDVKTNTFNSENQEEEIKDNPLAMSQGPSPANHSKKQTSDGSSLKDVKAASSGENSLKDVKTASSGENSLKGIKTASSGENSLKDVKAASSGENSLKDVKAASSGENSPTQKEALAKGNDLSQKYKIFNQEEFIKTQGEKVYFYRDGKYSFLINVLSAEKSAKEYVKSLRKRFPLWNFFIKPDNPQLRVYLGPFKTKSEALGFIENLITPSPFPNYFLEEEGIFP